MSSYSDVSSNFDSELENSEDASNDDFSSIASDEYETFSIQNSLPLPDISSSASSVSSQRYPTQYSNSSPHESFESGLSSPRNPTYHSNSSSRESIDGSFSSLTADSDSTQPISPHHEDLAVQSPQPADLLPSLRFFQPFPLQNNSQHGNLLNSNDNQSQFDAARAFSSNATTYSNQYLTQQAALNRNIISNQPHDHSIGRRTENIDSNFHFRDNQNVDWSTDSSVSRSFSFSAYSSDEDDDDSIDIGLSLHSDLQSDGSSQNDRNFNFRHVNSNSNINPVAGSNSNEVISISSSEHIEVISISSNEPIPNPRHQRRNGAEALSNPQYQFRRPVQNHSNRNSANHVNTNIDLLRVEMMRMLFHANSNNTFDEVFDLFQSRSPLPPNLTEENSQSRRGAKKETIDSISTFTLSDIPNQLGENRLECCICLEEFKVGQQIKNLKCSHVFHNACVDKWLSLNAVCPCCKFEVK